MAILRNLPANIVSEIGVKVQFATHEEWWQNLGNGLLKMQFFKTIILSGKLTDKMTPP